MRIRFKMVHHIHILLYVVKMIPLELGLKTNKCLQDSFMTQVFSGQGMGITIIVYFMDQCVDYYIFLLPCFTHCV